MNIGTMVNIRAMTVNFQNKTRHVAAMGEKKPTTFQHRLDTFRRDNSLNKINETKSKPEVEASRDGRRQTVGSKQLFSEWDGSLSAEEALTKLENNLSKIGDFSLKTSLEANEVLEHIGAQHAVYKRYIKQTGTSEQLQELDKLVSRTTKKYAKEFSETIGGFFEKNGLSGEKKRIYDSVMDSAESLAEVYGNYIDRNGKSFEALSEAAQLAKSSLSTALRKEVVDANRFHEQKYIKNYFSEELAAAARLVKFAERTQCVDSAFVTNEEELGIKLGKDFVAAMQFVGNLDKLSTHERIFLDSFNNYTGQFLDEVDKKLQNMDMAYQEKNPDSKQSPFNPLDRDAVRTIIDVMKNEYSETYSISAAIEKGKQVGLEQFLGKSSFDTESERYRGSSYWGSVMKSVLSPANAGTEQYRITINLLKQQINKRLTATA